MCKGCAILANFDEVLIAKNNKHDELSKKEKKSVDDYCKINVIYDDNEKRGYRLEIDHHEDKEIMALYREKGFLTRRNKPAKQITEIAEKFCAKHETEIFRVLCKHLESATIEGDQSNYSATIEGYQNNDSATIEGYQSNYSATIEGNQSNSSATIKGDQYNDLATIKGYQYNDLATIEGNQSNSSATIKGDQYNDLATIKGYQYNDLATIKGYQYNDLATIEGNQSNNSATIKGDIIIYKMKNGTQKFQKLLDEFTEKNTGDWKNATLENFAWWLMEARKPNHKKPQRSVI
jgi:hypothetical protein